jgi:hypothetical protein
MLNHSLNKLQRIPLVLRPVVEPGSVHWIFILCIFIPLVQVRLRLVISAFLDLNYRPLQNLYPSQPRPCVQVQFLS